MKKKLIDAMSECSKQTTQYEAFVQGLANDDVEGWERMTLAWEADPTNPSPYDANHSGTFTIQGYVST
jgi:hypothetical protein